ncbi:hypothetical protein VNI00_013909 [Paramarasmius palmivorus]|uniref:Uncharacterized protein n=1 Tax=Paramarasmius palmivorus TaxID=297713 RepID=A0AAW0BW06_9AGAR
MSGVQRGLGYALATRWELVGVFARGAASPLPSELALSSISRARVVDHQNVTPQMSIPLARVASCGWIYYLEEAACLPNVLHIHAVACDGKRKTKIRRFSHDTEEVQGFAPVDWALAPRNYQDTTILTSVF